MRDKGEKHLQVRIPDSKHDPKDVEGSIKQALKEMGLEYDTIEVGRYPYTMDGVHHYDVITTGLRKIRDAPGFVFGPRAQP